MSAGVQHLFFLGLPDLGQLVCTTLTLQEEEDEPRNKQIKACRKLVLLYKDVLASPAQDSVTGITVVMAVGSPQRVLPGVLQYCLSYSLISRLAPSWNKVGLYLISGNDFLSEGGVLNAVSMGLSTSEGQLCISVEASTVRLPPVALEDFDFPPIVLSRFCSDPDSCLDLEQARWCHVLPSMRRGEIIAVRRQLPSDGPFRTYGDLQNHWNSLYGYRLPELAEQELVYCSVCFRLLGNRLFTYPLSCIRMQPVQRCPRVDLHQTLGSFLPDIRDTLQSVCGFPARLTSKPRVHTVAPNTTTTVQELNSQVSTMSSSKLDISQVAALPPPQPVKPFCWSQPPAWTPLSQQGGAPGQSQGCQGDRTGPLSLSFSSTLTHFQAPLCLTSSTSSSSSSAHSSGPGPSQTPVYSPHKCVPVFKSKCSLHPGSDGLQPAQNQCLSGRVVERATVTAFDKGADSPSSSLPAPPPPTVPHFNHCPKRYSSTDPQPPAHPKLKRIFGPEIVLTPNQEIKSKSGPKTSSDGEAVAYSSSGRQEKAAKQPSAAPPEPPRPPPSSAVSSKDTCSSSRQEVVLESNVMQDVEEMARSHQLSRLSCATLSSERKGCAGQGQTLEGAPDLDDHGKSD
uniref:DUF4708 domain-containing protein n=1 Tax=Monopterus albus TaxID=43700 RepID=A0A3Q3K6H5_MONAL|nr:uncharacterized protein C18orf63 homolog isoform X2 [Monopterus albus]